MEDQTVDVFVSVQLQLAHNYGYQSLLSSTLFALDPDSALLICYLCFNCAVRAKVIKIVCPCPVKVAPLWLQASVEIAA